MSHLLMLNLGPVQGFIAAARRTRDLWFGSYLLSEVSKAAARSLLQTGARLIFPAPQSPADLENDDFNVANQLLAELPAGDPQTVLRQARTAAENCWKDLAEFAFLYADLAHLREDVWQRQRDDVLECTAAWVTVDESGYSPALATLWRLTAARKNTRNFLPAALTGTSAEKGYGLFKSSLDGLRETVLRKNLPARVRRRLGLGVGEQLDCPGLVKRLCGGAPERFTPISRIALDPWLRAIIPADRLNAVNAACETLVGLDWVTRVKGNGGIYDALPYDGQLLYPSRLATALRECQEEEMAEREPAIAALEALRAAVKPLWRDYGEPSPYIALLLADGDRMGALLDQAPDAGTHRAISARLARFAAAVPGLVRDHHGHCIYSGGDDVLALLPLDGALAGARALHDRFGEELKDIADAIGAGRPTLSVGIAVQHALEPLGRFRNLAKDAERLAKGDRLPEAQQRDGLAVIVQTRSGTAVEFRERWSQQPDRWLQEWMTLFTQGQLPDKTAYELRRLASDMSWAPDELAAAETKRILARKQGDEGRPVPEAVREKLAEQARNLGLERLVPGLLIARWLAQRTTGVR